MPPTAVAAQLGSFLAHAPGVPVEALDRILDTLAEFDSETAPVVSLYLDLRPEHRGTHKAFVEGAAKEYEDLQTDFEKVRAYLEANLTQDLDMNAVARAASLSPFYLTRIFKQRYGVPPYRYLIGLRIDYASDLLRESSLSVTQVCHRSGFNSLSHFITTFRRHTGMSPSQFRRVVDWQQDAGRFGQKTEPLVERPRRMNF